MNPLDRCNVVDTETTGLDPKTAAIVEVAVVNPYIEWCCLINPGHPIPAETSAVHHIMDSDVAGKRTWEVERPILIDLIKNPDGHLPILVAHNADFDKGFLGDIGQVIWICTYKCALRVWPDAPSHKNEVLRYWLGLGNRGRAFANAAHSALHDAKITHLILTELLNHATLDELVEWSEQPAKLPKMPMGKHFGQTWDTVPAPYLQWCCNQADMREDVKFCAKSELDRRRGKK